MAAVEETIVTRFVLEKEQFDAGVKEATKDVATFDKTTAGATAQTDKLTVKLGSASEKFRAMGVATKEVGSTSKQSLSGLLAELDKISKDSKVSADGLKTVKAALAEIAKTPQGKFALDQQLSKAQQEALDLLVTIKAISPEERKIAADAQKVTNALGGADKKIEGAVVQSRSLREQLRRVREEAILARRAGDEISYRKAIEEAGRLKDEIGDTNKAIDAFNPDQKFTAIAQGISGLAGGFTAAQGALALFGVESEGVEKALLRVQAAMAFSQGLSQLFGELPDALKTLKTIFLGTATSATVLATAEGGAAAAAVTQTVATEGATVATEGLGKQFLKTAATMLLSPIGLVIATLAALAATAYVVAKAFSDAELDIDGFLDKLKEVEDIDLKDIEFSTDLAKIESRNQLLREGNTITAQRSKIERDAAIDQDNINNKIREQKKLIDAAFDAQLKLDEQIGATGNSDAEFAADLAKKSTDEQFEQRTKLVEQQTESNKKIEELERSKSVVIRGLGADLNEFDAKNKDEQAKNAEKFNEERAKAAKAANELLVALDSDLTKIGKTELEKQAIDINKKYDDELTKARATFAELLKLTPAGEKSKVQGQQGNAEAAIQAKRNDELSALNNKFQQEQVAAQDAYLAKVESALLNAKDRAVQIEEDRWERIIDTEKAKGTLRVAEALKNGGDVEAVQAHVDASVGALELERTKSLLAARSALITANAEAEKQRLVQDAEDEFLDREKKGESFLDLQSALGEQLAEIDRAAADQKLALGQEVFNQQAALTEQQVQNEIAAAERKQAVQQAFLGQTEQLFGALSQLAEDQSEEQKALQTVQALVNTYSGIAAVFGNPVTIGPPPVDLAFRIISAAAVLANGLAAVRRIRAAYHGDPYVDGQPDLPGPRDNYSYRLHKGERVVTAKDNDTHWDLLESMRKGKLEQYIDLHYTEPALQELLRSAFGRDDTPDPMQVFVNYMDTPDGQRAQMSITMPPGYDYNIVSELKRSRKATEEGNAILRSWMRAERSGPIPSKRDR